jgi:hypothetical protein
MFHRALARWAHDALRLRREGFDQPHWKTAATNLAA